MPPLWPWSLRRDTCELVNDRMYDSYAQNMENLDLQISRPEPIKETENLPDPCRSCPGFQAPRRDSHWTDVNNEKINRTAGTASARRPSESPSSCGLTDHEYHEISEEEECFGDDAKSGESPVEAYFQKLDLGPSLMDEVFTALNRRQDDQDDLSRDEANNVRNEIKEITSREMGANGGHKDSGKRKHRGTVKPISPSDAKVIDSAIAIANEMATRNMLEMDSRSESDTAQDSPCTPSSPTKRKFSFRFTGKSNSPRAEKRNFTDEAASIPNIQETLTDSAKEAYNSLVEKRHFESTTSLVEEETNPLRMLRNGLNPVRPKVRGNKHSMKTNGGPSNATTQMAHDGHQLENGTIQSQSMENVRLATGNSQNFSGAFTFRAETTATLPRASGTWNSYCQKNGSSSTIHCSNTNGTASSWSATMGHTHVSDNGVVSPTSPNYPLDSEGLGLSNGIAPNLLPLPPRDRTKPMQNHKPRQRKHPLIMPTGNTRNLASLSSSMPDVNPVSPRSEAGSLSDKSSTSPLSPTECSNPVSPTEIPSACSSPRQETFLEPRLIGNSNCVSNGTMAPIKPPRAHGLDDSFDGQIQADMDSLDDIPEEEAPVPPMYRNSDHVSCEDLLDFACDLPNAKRTQGRARGIDSDEVRIMQKVLKSEVTPEECVVALNETDWDVHKAIKYLKLQLMLNMHLISIDNGKQTLMSCSWDVQKAYNYLMATYGIVEDSTEV